MPTVVTIYQWSLKTSYKYKEWSTGYDFEYQKLEQYKQKKNAVDVLFINSYSLCQSRVNNFLLILTWNFIYVCIERVLGFWLKFICAKNMNFKFFYDLNKKKRWILLLNHLEKIKKRQILGMAYCSKHNILSRKTSKK